MSDLVVTLSGNEAKLYQSMQKIIDQQKKLEEGFEKVKKKSKDANEDASKSTSESATALETTATKVTAVAAAYIGVETAVQAATKVIDEMIVKQKESYELALQVAKQQQESAKNLTGLTTPEIRKALVEDVPRIAREQGFADIPKLTEAIGAGYSASGNIDATISAVESAAALTRLEPQQLPTVAAGALDLVRGTGLNDARMNLGFLLSAGKAARIEDPARLSSTIAPTVSAGTATVPMQDRQQASIEIASVFNALNQQSVDRYGDTTRTATTTLLAYMDTFFSRREDDPGTIFGRIKALQSNDELRSEFFDKPFGEITFRKAYQMLADPMSDLAKEMERTATEVSFDTAIYDNKLSELGSATPQLTIASGVANVEASINANKLEDVKGATREAIAVIADKALAETRPIGIVDFLGATVESMAGMAGLSADRQAISLTTKELIESNITSLQFRRDRLESETPTADLQRKIELLDKAISEIDRLAESIGYVNESARKVADNLEKGSDEAKKLAKQRGAQSVGRE